MTMMKIIEQAARTTGLSHDSGFTKCHCSHGAEDGNSGLASYGALSRRRARARIRIS
jgi:hypothetical protein